MSIVADIKQAKAEHTQHLAAHRCSQLVQCPERSKLWRAYMATADQWGAEPDDDQRQREHFERNQKRPAA